MRPNKYVFFALIAFLSISVTSCLKDDDSEKRENEKRLIENYVQENNITVTPTVSGMYIIPQVEGTGATPADSNFVLIRYKATDLDGNFHDGTDTALAKSNQVLTTFKLGGPFKIYAGPNGFLKGIIEGLKSMKEGGKAKLIMPSLLAWDDYVPRIIELELIKVITNPKAYEQEQIATLLDTAYNKTLADSASSGIYYLEKVAGTGISPSTNKLAKIKYKGYLPDGRVFDKSVADKLFEFRLGTGKVIPGMDEGIRMMKKGGKATIVIPYYKAYGFAPVTSAYQVILPYFSSVVFDVELIDVVD